MTATPRPPRPRRQKKSDRLLCPGATALEIRCDMMLAPFDRAMSEAEYTWGIDRLPELVSIQTADKWGSAMAKLNAAMETNNPEEVAARAAVCIRGLAALEAEARAAGHQPKHPDVWEEEYEGRIFAVIRDIRDWPKINEDKNDRRRLYSMREVAIALNALDRGLVKECLDIFKDAEIKSIEKVEHEAVVYDDDIPF